MAMISKTAPLAIALCIAAASPVHAINIADCLANNSKAECSRQMLVEEDQSKPLAVGEEVTATSGKYAVRVQGENWLRNGFANHPDQVKDLGLVKGANIGILNYELSSVADADFESTLTSDMQGLFAGLQNGFRQGKLSISKSSEMELLPLTISGGNGLLGRFCYHIEVKDGKSACVYEGFISHGNGESVKFLGSIGDYDEMRTEMESIITSFQFKE